MSIKKFPKSWNYTRLDLSMYERISRGHLLQCFFYTCFICLFFKYLYILRKEMQKRDQGSSFFYLMCEDHGMSNWFTVPGIELEWAENDSFKDDIIFTPLLLEGSNDMFILINSDFVKIITIYLILLLSFLFLSRYHSVFAYIMFRI